MKFTRNQVLFREGDYNDKVYFIRSGSFFLLKGVLEPKAPSDDRDYLLQNTKTTIIFKENFLR